MQIRFQPSWILESLPPDAAKSIFMPISARANSLLWFKRLGIRMYLNEPLESRAVQLRTLLCNAQGFSEGNRRKFNRVIDKPLDLDLNPFKKWEGKPFKRSQLDYLFYWREAATEIAEPFQRDIFKTAVAWVMAYWISIAATEFEPAFNSDELLDYMLRKREKQLFESTEKIYVLSEPIEDLGEEVEAELFLVPLIFNGREKLENDFEVMYHAWFRGDPNLEAAADEIEKVRKGWVFDWKNGCNTGDMLSKAGKASYAVFTWSCTDLPPRWHEENVVAQLYGTFSKKFPKFNFQIKAVDASCDNYDYLLVMAENDSQLIKA